MTKIIRIYAVQILLGAIALAAGYAKLSGTGLMVQQFQVLGLGQGFLMVAGAVEIVAGLCLLLPRGGIVGALLLTCVMVGALGVTIGHVASAVAAQPASAHTMNSNYRASANSAAYDAAITVTIRRKTEWSI